MSKGGRTQGAKSNSSKQAHYWHKVEITLETYRLIIVSILQDALGPKRSDPRLK